MTEYICPHCRKPINDDEALLCLYCGESLGRRAGFLGGIRYGRLKVWIVLAVILSLLILIQIL